MATTVTRPGSAEASGEAWPAVSVLALVPASATGHERDALAAAVLDVLEHHDVPVEVVSGRAGMATAGVTAGLARRVRTRPPTHILCFDPALAPMAAAVHLAAGRQSRMLVFCSAADLVDVGRISRLVMGRMPVRLVATDSAAGTALSARYGAIDVLRPSVDEEAYGAMLSLEPAPEPGPTNAPKVLSVMPLDTAERQGFTTLLRACELVRARHADLVLTVAGPGRPSAALMDALSDRCNWARALTSTSLGDLRAAFAESHLFVLPAGPVPGRGSADGFGIPLIEAQLAAVPVIAPPTGYGADAFVEGVTGLRPLNGTAEALASCMRTFLDDEAILQRTGRSARLWASFTCSPGRFARQVRQIVLGAGAEEPRMPALALVSPLP